MKLMAIGDLGPGSVKGCKGQPGVVLVGSKDEVRALAPFLLLGDQCEVVDATEREALRDRSFAADKSAGEAWTKYRALKAAVRAVVESPWPAGSVERAPFERELRAMVRTGLPK